MLRLSKKIEYALIALVHFSRRGSAAPEASREISERYQIPPELLGKVLQTLTRAGLVHSLQGVKGGYLLAVPLSRITLGQLIAAVEGPLYMTPCALDDNLCQRESQCNIHRPILRLQEKLVAFLNELPLSAFLEEAPNDLPHEVNAWLPNPTPPSPSPTPAA